MKNEAVYLRHILDAIQNIETFTQDGHAAFLGDIKTQHAVLRDLQTLAESTQRLSPESKAAHPEIDWTGIAGARNLLVHDYLGVNPETVWSVIGKDLPPLKTAIQDLLNSIHKP
jgi:uncharacterized protein with HEPN domain